VGDLQSSIVRDGLTWSPHTLIEKYSPEQTAFAERTLAGEFSPLAISKGHDPAYRTALRAALRSTGDPEDGTAEGYGNLLTTAGLDAITKLLIATGSPQAFSGPTRAIVGVGATATAAAIGDTALGADGGSAYYQGCDSSNPTQANGVITTIATFASGNANFAWAEWGWATCTAAITPGATLASVATGTKLWSHKIQSLGTKASGASWVFTGVLTVSLCKSWLILWVKQLGKHVVSYPYGEKVPAACG
jgi:hypothetical protein